MNVITNRPYHTQDDGTLLVRTDAMVALQVRLMELSRIAKRIGVPGPKYEIVGYETREERSDDQYATSQLFTVRYAIVKITDEPVALSGGWEFIAAIDHTPEGNIIRRHPSYDGDLDEYRTAEPTCDHCNTARERKMTILARNEAGEFMRVGGSCVKQVLGGLPSLTSALWSYWDSILNPRDWLNSLEREFGGTQPTYTLAYLAIANAVIRRFGYRSAQNEDSTRSFVCEVMAGRDRANAPGWLSDFEVTDEDYASARATVEYLRNLDNASEFEQNMAIACSQPVLQQKHFGIVAYAPEAYRRSVEDAKVKEARKKLEDGPKTPVITGRIRITGTVVKAYSKVSNFGTQRKIIVQDDRGFKVCGSDTFCDDLEEGTRVSLTATVEPSDDLYFGFFKRPHDPQIIESE